MIELKKKEVTLDILFDTEQLFMKDLETPMHPLREIYHFFGDSRSVIGLGPNEFIDNPDPIGLFNPHSDPYEFLTVEHVEKNSKSPGVYGIEIVLWNEVHEYERTPFTLMVLLGELGGAYGIISALPPFFIATSVERMFKNQVAQHMPYKQRSNSNKRSRLSLQNRLGLAGSGHQNQSNQLTKDDV